jgi:uncharacterized protein
MQRDHRGGAGKRVAVIGASNNRRKFGNKAFRAFRANGYEAIPVNPTTAEVEGVRTYASVIDIPDRVDLATIYVPPEVGERVVPELAQKGILDVWFNPGSDDPDLVARARALGLRPIVACSIIDIGDSPSRY